MTALCGISLSLWIDPSFSGQLAEHRSESLPPSPVVKRISRVAKLFVAPVAAKRDRVIQIVAKFFVFRMRLGVNMMSVQPPSTRLLPAHLTRIFVSVESGFANL